MSSKRPALTVPRLQTCFLLNNPPLPFSPHIYTHPWRENTRLIQRAGGEHNFNPSAALAAAILRWLVVLHVSQLNKLVVSALWLYLFWYRLHLLRTEQNKTKEKKSSEAGQAAKSQSKRRVEGQQKGRSSRQAWLKNPEIKKSAHNVSQSAYEELKVWILKSQGNSSCPSLI